MKKIIAVLCVIVTLFTLAGCASDLRSVLDRIRPEETGTPQQQGQAGTDTPPPVTGTGAPAPEQVSEQPQAPSTILTVSDIVLSGMTSIERIDFTDEDGRKADMPADWNDWFNNATVLGAITLSGSVHMQLNGSTYAYTPSDGYALSIPFVVDGREYMIGVRIGAQFAVRKESGGYALVPEETMLLSPAPPPQAPAAGIMDAECSLRAVTPGGLALDPNDGNVGFIVNGVTQSSGTFAAATDAFFTLLLTFTLDEPVSPETRLCLTGSNGGYLERSQKLEFGSGQQKLEAVMNAGAPADNAYEVELYFDGELVFSDYIELQ